MKLDLPKIFVGYMLIFLSIIVILFADFTQGLTSQSVMAYGTGIVIRSIIQQIEMLKFSSEISMVKLGSIGCSGVLVGAVSCLIA
ncbi:hypothetical protein [uncultured Tolumonas sp.]|uniref:hypothetical protein n=1 Tax=uncultured Tolumonas sp. TaxID=263765 RepID=UPI00292DFF73|nr:hypothetical protein [uncultured Tolumonas sp.]